MRSILTPTNRDAKPTYLVYDNLDDRREIFCLLNRLTPLRRVAFLQWFLDQAQLGPWKRTPGGQIGPLVVADETIQLARQAMNDDAAAERLQHEVWTNLWQVSDACEIGLDVAFRRLVELAKGKS